MSDLYCQIADNRPVRSFEHRIAILDIGTLNRAEIAEVLSILSLCEPRSVAIDINFELPSDHDPTIDSTLVAALRTLPGLVLPLGLSQKGNRFEITDKPFFYGSLPEASYGAVNFPTSRARATVRDYAVEFPLLDGTRLLSFPEAAAKQAGFMKAPTVVSEDVPTGIIAYHSKEFTTIHHSELPDRLEELHDKIVLVGTTSEAGDVYSTPLRSGVSGLEIHAYALSTILDGSPLHRLPPYAADIVAVILCFLMVWGAVGITWGARALILRLAQVAALYFLVWAGYVMLVDHNTVSDFSQAILMVAFGLFAADLWTGLEAIVKWCKKKFYNYKSKYKAEQPT